MKIVTVFGTRPEIIRLSETIKVLDRVCENVLVHTGQNHDFELSEIFLRQLEVRQPDVHLGVRSSGFPEQLGLIAAGVAAVLEREKPDRVLILGDTNSGLSAIVAARRGIPVYHMEAGNRCFDDRVPEEINRRIIDHCSAVLMPYTQRSKENLLREGIERQRIFVTGNPIFEVLEAHAAQIDASKALESLGLAEGGYFLATLHRAENVDEPARLASLFDGLGRVGEQFGQPVVVSLHPRTADRLAANGLAPRSGLVRLAKPFGFFDFVQLEKHARCVLTDSGTVQEECCIVGVPNVTLRDVTERAETIEVGSSILTGADPATIVSAVALVLERRRAWVVPPEYLEPAVSSTVANILLGFKLEP
jgi:UDP-N-acetylglucosamine 2-epimerase (non-hydrolysing)